MNIPLILEQLRDRLAILGLQLVDFIPNVIAALLVMLFGWLLAWVMKTFIRRLGMSLLARLARFDLVDRSLDRGVGQSVPRVMAGVSYWVVLLVFAAVAVDQLGIDVITQLFSRLTQYLPDVLLAAVIIFVGLVLGNGARQAVESGAESAGVTNARTLGRLAQMGVVTAAALVAADQIGVESTLLIVAFAVVTGAALGGIALAFGIGSGPMVSNIIASRNVQKVYRIGQSVRIGSIEGRILEIGHTSVLIDTSDGTVHVPASRFAEEVSVLLPEA